MISTFKYITIAVRKGITSTLIISAPCSIFFMYNMWVSFTQWVLPLDRRFNKAS